MATIQRFEELICWQKARLIDSHIYKMTRQQGFKQDFSLVDQITRASGSVMDNIAEGFERDGTREFINFLSIAKGSAGEVRSQCYRANDRGYIDEEEFRTIYSLSLDISRRIGNLMSYLRTSGIKGIKFKVEEPAPLYQAKHTELQATAWNIPEDHLSPFTENKLFLDLKLKKQRSMKRHSH